MKNGRAIGVALLHLSTVVGILAAEADSLANSHQDRTDRALPTNRALQQRRRGRATGRGTFEIIETASHDANAYTQGLSLLEDGTLFESTGLYGQSSIRIVDLATGSVLKQVNLDSKYFGEGTTHFPSPGGSFRRDINGTTVDRQGAPGRLIQLTWKERTGFIYNSSDLTLISSFSFRSTRQQGWGITYDPSRNVLWMSDGSSFLHQWNVDTLRVQRRIWVNIRYPSQNFPTPVIRLNELEWDPATDTILANVWLTNRIVRINPNTGRVITNYDLSFLYPQRPPNADVLNGIATTPTLSNLTQAWVTGKRWPIMFRIRFVDN